MLSTHLEEMLPTGTGDIFMRFAGSPPRWCGCSCGCVSAVRSGVELPAGCRQGVAGTWIERGRAAVVSVVPDATGFPVEVRAECREGTYRVHVVVEGTGPTPSSVPFRFDDTGPEHTYALVDCAG